MVIAPKPAARSAICVAGPGSSSVAIGVGFAMVIGTGFAVVIGGHGMSAVVIGARPLAYTACYHTRVEEPITTADIPCPPITTANPVPITIANPTPIATELLP
eukprot:131450-Chlamydomonas_euryale.AAC.1